MALPQAPIETIISVVKAGQQIREQYLIYTHAEADLKELDSRLRASLLVLEIFQKVVERDIGNLLYRQQQDLAALIGNLHSVFDRLEKQLSRFPRNKSIDFLGKLRWTFNGKSGYEAILEEMAKWRSEVHDVIDAIKLLQEVERDEDQNLYKTLFEECGGPGVQSASRMEGALHSGEDMPEVDQSMLALFKAEDNLRDGDRAIIKAHSTFAERRNLDVWSPQEIREVMSDVKKLAFVLTKVDAASTHILRCKGAALDSHLMYHQSVLFYEIPSEPTPDMMWTLAQAMEDAQRIKPTLDVRVCYAVEIATAVMFTHAAGLVHKSISAGNFLILKNSAASKAQHEMSTYLVGFDAARFRDPSAFTARRPEVDPLKRIYQHPERQIADLEGQVVRFGIRHDMYSLGVVLLEVGLWRRIQRIDDPVLQSLVSAKGHAYDPRRLQDRLVQLVEEVGGSAGSKYAAAVRCCLRDTDSEQTSEREMREMFYNRVLRDLKQIVV